MSDGMGREPAYLSSHATNRYFIPNWGIILIIPYSSFAQKQLVRSVYKGAKGLFRAEAKVLTKEGIKATNKEMLEGAFKSGAKEISKDYVRNASAKQLVRSAVRKNLLKEIEEKELRSLLRYGMVSAEKQIDIQRNLPLRLWQRNRQKM